MRSSVRVLPELFLERLRKIIPSQKFDAVANTFSDSKPITFRINTLKTNRSPSPLSSPPQRGRGKGEGVKERLEREGFRLESISWYPDAFILREGRLKDLEKTEIYKNGEIYVQNLSSMIPPLVLDPKPGEIVLDLTAAPGSKTTQMACLMNSEDKIIANESDKVRFEKLKTNLEIQGATNVKAILGYGESIGKKYPEYFDKILLDAPCSVEGRFDVRAPSSYRYWNLKTVQESAKLQKKLIASALSALKPGGILVYSTCTFAPEENEEVINDALEKFKGTVEIVDAGALPCGRPMPREQDQGRHGGLPLHLILNQMPGLISWEGRKFHPSVKKSIRVLPTETMEGFFIAKAHKIR
jgi:16S rRNA (cytosine1407-C5)-methyltransferase